MDTALAIDPRAPSAAPGHDLLELDNQLCFALYAAAHAMTRAYAPMLGRVGLTYPQYLVLVVLWEQDGQTVSQLGGRLMLDSGTLSPLLSRLEGAGLVTRHRRRDDAREVEIRLTAHGRALHQTAGDIRASIVCRLGMSEAEIGAIRHDLARIIETLTLKPADRRRAR